ncbi:MAG: sensor histidine kinase [Spirochaetota bacterium]
MNHRSWFPKSGLGRKLFASYMLTTFLPLLAINAVSLVQLSADIRRAREEQITAELRSLQESVSLVLYDLYYGLESLAGEPQLHDFLETSHVGVIPFYHDFHDNVRPIFSRFLTFSRAASRISLLTTNEQIIRFARSLSLNDAIMGDDLSDLQATGQVIILRDRLPLAPPTASASLPVFIRKVIAPFSDDTHAVALTLNVPYLRQSVERFGLNSDVTLLSPDRREVATFTLNERDSSRGHTPLDFSLDFVFPGTSDRWTIEARVFDVPRVELVGSYLTYSALGFLLVLVISFSRNLIFSRRVSKRLAELQVYSERIGRMQYETLPDDRAADEISALRSTMNTMTLRIKNLIEEVLQGQLREHKLEAEQRRAELHALQSRVNPHVFFNTLESIRMRSIAKQEDETAEILNQLALLFRRTYSWKDEFSTVEQELQFVGYLVSVHQYRFGERIRYVEDVGPDVRSIEIPKFCIQTVVENALLHGVESKGGGTVELRGVREGEVLIVTIQDDGAGMEPELVETLRAQMVAGEIRDDHVGLTNVAARLAMHYDGAARIAIASTPADGTTVTLRLPTTRAI